MKISKHFRRSDFACKCGKCNCDTIDAVTLKICEVVRMYVGKPITPSSGHRCHEYNTSVGGGRKSRHLHGRAVHLPAADVEDVYQMLCKKYPNKYGFGLYDGYIHIDTRSGGPARWDDRN